MYPYFLPLLTPFIYPPLLPLSLGHGESGPRGGAGHTGLYETGSGRMAINFPGTSICI